MILKGEKVILRALEYEDLEFLRETINDPEIEKLVCGWAYPISKSQQIDWYEKTLNENKILRFVAETEEHGVIGVADIRDIDWKNRVAFHGIKIGNSKIRGKGYGKDIVFTIMKYAFEELNLNRLDGAILDYNEGSKKLYLEKCGWKVEGVRRKYIFKNNKYNDMLVVGILKEEYLKMKDSN